MKKIETPNTTPIKQDMIKYKIRNVIDNMYDMQKLRIAVGNRICASYRMEHNIAGNGDENVENDKFLKSTVKDYERITDIYAEQFSNKGRITKAIKAADTETIKDEMDYNLIKSYYELLKSEERVGSVLGKLVVQHPMWDKFFKDVKGCGPTIAGFCIAYLDVHAARHVSSFWSYAGVGTRTDANGNRVAMTKQVTVEVEYTDKNGEVKKKKSIGYNPDLQSKLLAVFVGSVLKAGADSKYAKCYYDYKTRYTNRADLKGASKLRIHKMASRQCVKAFLRDLWVDWRSYEGYEISQPYEVEYLGNAPHLYNEAHARRSTV